MMIVAYWKAIASEVDLLLYLSDSVVQVGRCLHELMADGGRVIITISPPTHT